jgi:hypothetical protein
VEEKHLKENLRMDIHQERYCPEQKEDGEVFTSGN